MSNLTWLPYQRYEAGKWGWIDGKAQQMANLLGRADGRTQEQGNTFAVTICGKTVEPSFSPASEGRNMQACKVRYIVENEGDCIDIKMLPKKARLSCRE